MVIVLRLVTTSYAAVGCGVVVQLQLSLHRQYWRQLQLVTQLQRAWCLLTNYFLFLFKLTTKSLHSQQQYSHSEYISQLSNKKLQMEG